PSAGLWADSHARALARAVASAFAAHGEAAVVFASGGCPPLAGVEFGHRTPRFGMPAIDGWLAKRQAHCAPHNDAGLAWIDAHRIPEVILAAHWIAYVDTQKVPS